MPSNKQNNFRIVVTVVLMLTFVIVLLLTLYLFQKDVSDYNTLAEPKELTINTQVNNIQENNSNIFGRIVSNISSSSEKDLNYEDYLFSINTRKEIQAKMKLLTIPTNTSNTLDQTCNFNDAQETTDCKRDLFVGCADSLYLGLEMAPECQQFREQDYIKYIEVRKKQDDEKIVNGETILTSYGEVNLNKQEHVSKNDPDIINSINSGSINTDRSITSKETLLEERKIIEPEKPAEPAPKPIFWNRSARSSFYGWVTGWGTLFAINGGRNEAGQVMNQYTAFGYNPYLPNTCIVSLPYKTIDKFFGTNLNHCVKTKNTQCIIKIKNQIKDRAIEVVMLKNGKRAVFPLGDLGPAEWTGNAIDFTSCARKSIGATGKDLIKFRPLP